GNVPHQLHVLLLAALADAAVVVGNRRTRRDGECAQDGRIQRALPWASSTSSCRHGSSSSDVERQVPSQANSVASGNFRAIGKGGDFATNVAENCSSRLRQVKPRQRSGTARPRP